MKRGMRFRYDAHHLRKGEPLVKTWSTAQI
jgi:hypothetical protein